MFGSLSFFFQYTLVEETHVEEGRREFRFPCDPFFGG